MAKAATISGTTAKKLVREIEEFEELKQYVLRSIPDNILPYGSKLWWEKENLEADEDIKKGRVHGPFKTADTLIKSLHKNARA